VFEIKLFRSSSGSDDFEKQLNLQNPWFKRFKKVPAAWKHSSAGKLTAAANKLEIKPGR